MTARVKVADDGVAAPAYRVGQFALGLAQIFRHPRPLEHWELINLVASSSDAGYLRKVTH